MLRLIKLAAITLGPGWIVENDKFHPSVTDRSLSFVSASILKACEPPKVRLRSVAARIAAAWFVRRLGALIMART